MKRFYVYMFYDYNGKVVYVGRTNNIEKRIKQHFRGQGNLSKHQYEQVFKVVYAELPSMNDSIIYETYYISMFNPKFNTSLNDGVGTSVIIVNEPKFVEYKDFKDTAYYVRQRTIMGKEKFKEWLENLKCVEKKIKKDINKPNLHEVLKENIERNNMMLEHYHEKVTKIIGNTTHNPKKKQPFLRRLYRLLI